MDLTPAEIARLLARRPDGFMGRVLVQAAATLPDLEITDVTIDGATLRVDLLHPSTGKTVWMTADLIAIDREALARDGVTLEVHEHLPADDVLISRHHVGGKETR